MFRAMLEDRVMAVVVMICIPPAESIVRELPRLQAQSEPAECRDWPVESASVASAIVNNLSDDRSAFE
jgi:hypothetical protein